MSDTEEATATEAIEATEVADPALQDQADDQSTDEGVEGGDADDQSEAADPELEEVEWEGKKVRVPAEVKAALMRTADYTRKTQVVAEQAKAVAARETEITQRAEVLEATIQERAELVAIERQIAAFEKMGDDDWDALEDEDPKQARKLQRQRDSLKDRAAELKGTLQTKETEALTAKRTRFATRVQESQAVLARDIKGWGPKLAQEITQYGTAKGLSNDDLLELNTKPALVKVLHEALLGSQALKREAAAKKLTDAQQTRPLTEVGGSSPSSRRTTDASGDGLSTKEWMAREEARVAAKRKEG
jgi:hypothetical protein